MSKKYSYLNWGLLSASLLILCGCPDQNIAKTSLSPGVVSSTPVVTVSTSATTEPSIQPSNIPSPSEQSSVTPSIANISYSGIIKGKIVDERGMTVSDAKVKISSQNANVPYEKEQTAFSGSYIFTDAPVGIKTEITVTKTGYTSRRNKIVYIASFGKNDVFTMNFGLDDTGKPDPTTSISDKPEVVSITPADGATDVDPRAAIKIRFSEPVDKMSVENNFIIRNKNYTIFSSKGSFGGNNKDVYDKTYYNSTWNETVDEVTFTPKKAVAVPSDTDPNNVPEYYITFKDVFKDISGMTSRSLNTDDGIKAKDIIKGDGPFKSTYTFTTGSPFKVAADKTSPRIESVSFDTSSSIKVKFSKPMTLYPLTIGTPFYDPNLSNPLTYIIKADLNNDGSYNDPGEIMDKAYQVVLNLNEPDSINLILSMPASYQDKKIWIGLADNMSLTDPTGNAVFNWK